MAFWTACVTLGAPPKEVLLLHSFGREFEPFKTFSATFRTQLAEQLGEPVEFHDVPLESARIDGGASEGPLVDYLTTLFASPQLDLVVTIGGPAARFGQKYRPRLFPMTPMLLAAVDQRHLQMVALTTNDAVVAVDNNPARMLENMLQVLPETTNVAVVIGSSPLEKFWRGEVGRLFQPFTNRLSFAWFNDLSLTQMQQRAAALPPRSAVFYAVLVIDADGVPQEEERALSRLYAVANAPIFGLQESQMGRGIVGGSVMPIEELSRTTAKVAVRILRGELAGSIQTPTLIPEKCVYDWRELKRWGIQETHLPAGSRILFRELTFWETYKFRLVALIALCLIEAGLIVQLVATLVRRRRAEQSLRESEERLALATEVAGVGIWMRELSGNEVLATPIWRRMFGFLPGDVLRYETFQERILPEDRMRFAQTILEVTRSRGSYHAEYRVVLPDGGLRWIASRGSFCSAASAKKEWILGASIDITERKAAEAALLEYADRFRAMTTTTTDCFWLMNSKGRIIDVNDESCRLYGYNRSEFLAKSVEDFEANGSSDVSGAHLKAITATGFGRFETRHRRKDGRIVDVEFSATYRPQSDNLVTFIRNVTERKQNEAELRQQREELAHVARVSVMGELAASVAHELNQPLGAILSNAEAAELFLEQDQPPRHELRAILVEIRKDDERAGEVIRRMRALLRKHELEEEPVSINSVVADVLQLVSADASLRQTAIATDLSPHHPTIQGDHIHMQQVLLNLMLNALEALAKKPPEARQITVRTSRSSHGVVEVSVADSGFGIESAILQHLFDPFFTTKPNGIGMGLAISRRIVEAHHGRIWAENQPAGGAIFRVTLPAVTEGMKA